MKMIATEEPIVSRLDRLDNILRHLEETRGVNSRSARSSYASTHSSETTSDTHDASTDTSPKSLDIHCRSIDDVITETQVKGTLLDRLVHVEDRVIKLCLQLETELDSGNSRADSTTHKKGNRLKDENAMAPKKGSGLKQLVKSCMKANKKNKANNKT